MACCAVTPLAITRTADGWVQRSTYMHPELHHELVEELAHRAGPLAVAAPLSSAVSFTFLLLGDQNAGKSTFLHAFTHAGDGAWLELVSLLPILSSSFVNAQLVGTAKSASSPSMDEPPFIDTDVGRASFLVTLEDFAFLVDEFALPLPRDRLQRLATDDAVRYAAIELIEVGGDHLDRMMATAHAQAHPPPLRLALRRSEQLLASAHRTVYFLNAEELLRTQPATAATRNADGSTSTPTGSEAHIRPVGSLRVDAPALEQLVRRLRYLASVLPRGQRVGFHLCRLAEDAAFDALDLRASVAELNALVSSAGGRLDAASLEKRAVARVSARRDEAARRIDACSELHPEIRLFAPPPERLALLCEFVVELLRDLLHGDAAAELLRLESVDVASHVLSSGTEGPGGPRGGQSGLGGLSGPFMSLGEPAMRALDVRAIVCTLAKLFDEESMQRPPPPPTVTALMAAATHLLRCFRDVTRRLTDCSDADGTLVGAGGKRRRGATSPRGSLSFDPWVSRDEWVDYLGDVAFSLDLPVNVIAASFEPLVARLVAAGLAIPHHSDGYANIAISFQLHSRGGQAMVPAEILQREWRPGRHAPPRSSTAVRFPLCAPLLDAMSGSIDAGLPVDWWLGGEGEGVAVAVDEEAVLAAEVALRDRLQEQLLLHMAAESEDSFCVFVWMLEEWCMAQTLVGRRARKPAPLRLQLNAPEEVWQRVLLPHLEPTSPLGVGETAADEPAAEPRWRVELEIIEAEDADTTCLVCE